MVLLFMIGLNWERIVSLLAVPKIPILTSSSRKYSTVGTHRMPYHSPRFGFRSSLTVASFRSSTNSVAISSIAPSNMTEGRLHPVANSTSTGWLDFKTSVSKFASSISMIRLMLAGVFFCFYRLIGQLSCDQVALGRLEKADQFRQAPLVGVAGGTVTVGSDPIGVLDAQVFVNLLLKLAVRMNLVRHDNFLDEGLSQIAFRFNCSGYDLLSPRRYCACVGFCVTTREVMDAPSYGGAQNSYEYG